MSCSISIKFLSPLLTIYLKPLFLHFKETQKLDF